MCADVRALLPDWAADRLTPSARRAVEAHLAGCAACRAEADGWTALASAAHAFVAAAGPPPVWRSPLEVEHERVGVIPLARSMPRRRPSVSTAVAALALAASVALAIIAGDLSPWHRGPARDADRAVRPAPALSPATIVARAPTRVARLVAAAGAERGTVAAGPAESADSVGKVDRGRRTDGTDGTDRSDPGASANRADPAAAASASLAANAVRPTPGPAGGSSSDPEGAGRTPATRSAPSSPPSSPSAPTPTAPPSPSDPATSTPPLQAQPPTPSTPSAPAPPPGAAVVTGIVTGPDGFERAEVRIVALPVDQAEAPHGATTGADGAFMLVLPPGRWSVHAEAPTYLLAWPDGALTPLASAPIDVAAGETARVAFSLSPASFGAIRGRVVDPTGAPAAGALVVAAAPDTERGGYTAFVAAAFADADGRYALAVDDGAWLVAATTDWRAPNLTWWGGDGDLVAVDWVAVSRERAADGIDITLRADQGR